MDSTDRSLAELEADVARALRHIDLAGRRAVAALRRPLDMRPIETSDCRPEVVRVAVPLDTPVDVRRPVEMRPEPEPPVGHALVRTVLLPLVAVLAMCVVVLVIIG